MSRRTVPFPVSRFVLAELSTATKEVVLEREARRVGTVGPAILRLDVDGLADLADLLDALADSSARAGNTSGARTCYQHAERARQAARELSTNDWSTGAMPDGLPTTQGRAKREPRRFAVVRVADGSGVADGGALHVALPRPHGAKRHVALRLG